MSAKIDVQFAVFDEAVLLPEDRVASFLEARCGDDTELRRRVEDLLRAHRRSVEMTVHADGSSGHGLDDPERIAAYRIVSTLGEGGMGVVYLAEQDEPIRRRVALKLVKPGMDSKEVVARFEAERQALAMMSYPGIAKILDAGVHEGRPFFVMELVEGDSITEYCADENLELRERLEVLIAVCDAVQHAHSKGIIHRDLKPSNVLVHREDGRAVPKIIDFGIAKALTSPLSKATLITTHGQILGTPAYMSPEQIELGGLGIDARSDVYALGALLYEVLTGRPPIDPETLATSGIDEIRRIIREVDPPRPSGAIPPGAPAERWSTELRRDLDWVVMRCLEKDPDRRYASAISISEDLRRYLRREPVEAGPPSGWYRARKMVQRHRVPMVAGATVVVALVLGVVGTSLALAEAVSAREVAMTQTGVAEEQRRAAEQQESIAEAVVTFLNEGLLSSVDPRRGNNNDLTMREALDVAASEIDGQFEGQPLTEARIRFVIGSMYDRLSEPVESEKHHRIAFELYDAHAGPLTDETLGALDALATALMAQVRPLEARKLLLEEIGRIETREEAPAPAAMLRAKSQLATTYLITEDYETATPRLAEVLGLKKKELGSDHVSTLTSMHNLGSLYFAIGQFENAIEVLRPCVEGRERTLGPGDPSTILTMSVLASAFESTGRVEEALPIGRLAAERAHRSLGPLHRSTHNAELALARCYQTIERYEEAELIVAKRLEAERNAFGNSHRQTIESMSMLSSLYGSMGEFEEALALSREALASISELYGPDTMRVVIMRENLMWQLFALERYAEAESIAVAAAEAMLEKPGAGHLATSATVRALVNFYGQWHALDSAAGHDARAAEWRERGGIE